MTSKRRDLDPRHKTVRSLVVRAGMFSFKNTRQFLKRYEHRRFGCVEQTCNQAPFTYIQPELFRFFLARSVYRGKLLLLSLAGPHYPSSVIKSKTST